MAAQRKKIAIDLSRKNEPRQSVTESKDKLTRCLISSIDITSSHLAKTISNLLNTENEPEVIKLFKSAGINNTTSSEHELLSEYQQLRKNSQYIGQQFVDELIVLFTDNISILRNGPKSFTFNQADNLLLDSNENKIEELAIIANLTTRAQKQYSDNLGALYKRYLSAFENSGIRKNTLPLGPEQICHAFMKTLDIYNTSDNLKKVSYKLFDTHVIQNLAPLYKNINDLFHDAGILPGLIFEQGSISNNKVIKQKIVEVKPLPAIHRSTHLKDGASGKADIFGVFMHLILMKKHMDSVSQYNSSTYSNDKFNEKNHVIESKNKSTISADKLNSLLSLIQRKEKLLLLINKKKVLDGKIIHDFISDEISKESKILSEKIDQSDMACIELVCMLFNTIQDDHNLPWHMKKLIISLQVAIIKIALTDKDFFNKQNHPARAFIDLLTTSSICWNELNNVSDDPLYLESNRIAKDILSTNKPDAATFNQAINNLKSFLEINANSRELLIQDRQKAEETAAREINTLVNNQNIPATILQFITTNWKDVFTKIATDEGIKSKSWKNILELTRDIINSTQPKFTDKEKQDLLSSIPALINGIQDGLSRISTNRKQIKHFISQLETIHLASLKGNLIDVFNVATPEPEIDKITNEADDIFNTDKLIAEIDFVTAKIENLDITNNKSDVYQETIDNLAIGNWLEFTEDNSNKLRLKLAWKNKQSGEYSFVDRSGTIVAETPVSQLVSDFRDGHIHIIDTSSMTDRAFNLVRRNLKKYVLNK